MAKNSRSLTMIQRGTICFAAGGIDGLAKTNDLLSVIAPYRALGGGWEPTGQSWLPQVYG
jgi:hypothetical protein